MNQIAFTVNRESVSLPGSVSGDGPPLLFLHGLTATADAQRDNAPPAYRVAAYDQRAHGRATPVTEPGRLTVGDFVEDALAVLDYLAWERPVIAGSSMGAAIALSLALECPQRVRALILVAPAFGDRLNSEIARFDLMAELVEQQGIEAAIPLMRTAQISRGFPPESTQFLDSWLAHDPEALAAALRTVSRWVPFPQLEVIGSLQAPTLILSWPDDPMHPAELAERIAVAAGASMVRFESLYEALAHPDRVGRALEAPLVALLYGDENASPSDARQGTR